MDSLKKLQATGDQDNKRFEWGDLLIPAGALWLAGVHVLALIQLAMFVYG